MHSIVITGISFCAAHRVEGHPKCSRPHGHNYEISFEVSSALLNDMQFVVDFGEVKALAKRFIDENWDHRFLFSRRNVENKCVYYIAAKTDVMTVDDAVLLPIEQTTAECLAEYLASMWALQFYKRWNVWLNWVEVRETPTSSARFYPSKIAE